MTDDEYAQAAQRFMHGLDKFVAKWTGLPEPAPIEDQVKDQHQAEETQR